MKKKLFTLMTLLLCLCSTAWADDCTTLVSFATSQHQTSSPRKVYGYTSTEMTEASRIELTCDNSNTKGQNDGVEIRLDYGKYLQIPSQTSVTSVTIDYKFYNSGNTERTCSLKVAVGSTEKQVQISGKNSDGYQTAEFTFSPAATGVITITNMGSGNSNMNLYLDNITYCTASATPASSNPTLTGASSSPAASATNVAVSGTGYLKFNKNLSSVDASKITIAPTTGDAGSEALSSIAIDGTDASKVNYSWSGLKKETSYTITIAAGAVSDGTNTNAATSLSFTTVNKTALTAAWSAAAPTFSKGADASGSLPTFTVTGGTLGTDYTVEYSKTDANNIVTLTDGNGPISAINTDAAATAKVTATVTVTNTDNFKIATTAYDCNITVANTHTVTYNANGGTGTAPTDATEYAEGASVKVVDNIGTLTKSGYSVVGWNTDPDATTASQAFGSSFNMGNTDVTLYAIWQENFYEFTPKSVTESENVNKTVGTIIESSTGGVMKNTQTDTTDGRLQYTQQGLLFNGSSNSRLTVTLNDFMQVGSVITATFYMNDGKDDRGVDILNASGTDKGDWYFKGDSKIHVFAYTVQANDGFAGYNSFSLKRKGNAYLKSLTVTNCQPGGVITESGWNTYSSIKALDLSSISGGTVYVASATSGNSVTLTECTDKVAAGTGLMIKGTAGATFTINTTADAATFSGTNLLEGLPNGGKVAANAYNYVFAWPTATPADYGFYYVNATEPTLPAGKAYLHVDGGINARLNIVFDGETTGINTIENSQLTIDNDASMYNLAGQKVSKSYKGIVIVNGKKVVRK